MIKSKEGKVVIEGDYQGVIFEFHQLIRVMCENYPELVVATVYKNGGNIQNAIAKSNIEQLHMIADAIDFY